MHEAGKVGGVALIAGDHAAPLFGVRDRPPALLWCGRIGKDAAKLFEHSRLEVRVEGWRRHLYLRI